jgi:DNA-binding response OmpR family regulator
MCRILVVNQSRLVRDGLAAALSNEGYDAAVSATGRDAWMTLYSETPDLIVLDLALPGLDGLLFLRQLRCSELWRSVPVLACREDQQDRFVAREARELGVAGVVSKSTGTDALLAQIHRLTPLGSTHAEPARMSVA